jgi:hypothetical protein
VNAAGFNIYMGIGAVDLRIDLHNTNKAAARQFSRIVQLLEADPDVARIAPMVTIRNGTVDKDGNAVSLYVKTGDHTRLPPTYADGRAALNQAGRQVGDTLSDESAGRTAN